MFSVSDQRGVLSRSSHLVTFSKVYKLHDMHTTYAERYRQLSSTHFR